MSEEEEAKFFDAAYNESLDNPNVDKKVNMGTTAPNCQPKHTLQYDSSSDEDDDGGGGGEELGDDGTEVKLEDCGNVKIQSPAAKSKQQNNKKKSDKSNSNKDSSSSKQKKKSGGAKKDDAKERERKMGYVQMIKMGYQELVNAIIRPPRAEYKVSL